jgi:DNA mismatch endonuclease (patch repair protein)
MLVCGFAFSTVMHDRLTPEARSAHMRLIHKTNTRPEICVRQVAHALGFRFRLHRSELPGTPDLGFPSLRKVIFVHGCFWHQHPGCKLARQPKSRLDYWLPKLRRNQERDRERLKALTAMGELCRNLGDGSIWRRG